MDYRTPEIGGIVSCVMNVNITYRHSFFKMRFKVWNLEGMFEIWDSFPPQIGKLSCFLLTMGRKPFHTGFMCPNLPAHPSMKWLCNCIGHILCKVVLVSCRFTYFECVESRVATVWTLL